jgi:TolA-binding protein
MSDSLTSPATSSRPIPFEISSLWESPRFWLACGILVIALIGSGLAWLWTKHQQTQATLQAQQAYDVASSPAEKFALAQKHLHRPATAAWLVTLGNTFSETKDFADAEKAFQLVTQHFPSSPLTLSAHLGLAQIAQKQGTPTQVLAHLQAATQQSNSHPLHAYALLHLAQAYVTAQQFPEAQKSLDTLIAFHPESAFLREARALQATLPKRS